MPNATVLWLDGCFDGFHYAHANAIRQSLTLIPGTVSEVIASIHSDASIAKNKGPPLFDEHERYSLIKGCRWVTRVVEDTPYVTQMDVFERFTLAARVDFVVHGDDPVQDAEGNDCFAFAKAVGKYKEFTRTKGISTTSLIQRILHPELPLPDEAPLIGLLRTFAVSMSPPLRITDLAHDIPQELGSTLGNMSKREMVGYIGGSWDCFSAGHVECLREARKLLACGNESEQWRDDEVKLVVGVWTNEVVLKETGERPLLLMLERALAVAQCRYTDAIVLSAAPDIDDVTLSSLGIDMVVFLAGQKSGKNQPKRLPFIELPYEAGEGAYTLSRLREKVYAGREQYEERQRRKTSRSGLID